MAYDKQDSFLLMYTTPDGVTKVDVAFEEDTVWLSTAQMAELFQRDRSVKNVFEEGGATERKQCANFAHCKF